MSASKNFDRVCAVLVVLGVLLTVLFMNGSALGIQEADRALGYENRLFDASRVHTIALVVDDWDDFIENCEDEEYVVCAAVIDGESYKNVALRAKGNTSLSSVRTMGSSRYSFKLEFDHFNKNETYHGLDKLCLNNIIQDKTYMKDFLTYRLMADFGVDAPLCSYVYITVNGEDWGLYLAVEGVEDSFLQRNYGNDGGELYKPDSMGMGGGRGNGREFDMDEILQELFGEDVDVSQLSEEEIRDKLDEVGPPSMGGFSGMPGDGSFPGGEGMPGGNPFASGDGESLGPSNGFPGGMDGFTPPDMGGAPGDDSASSERKGRSGGGPGGGFPGGFGMGSDDVKLRYIDDDPDSYSSIFGNAKTVVTEADKARLIASLKQLSEGTELSEVLDIDEVLRYFVIHNFVVNGDSYTGSMIHNYYLHESNGRLSMIPWDYNLGFGTFQASNATSSVNDPIDTPLSVGSGDSRPMADWIFENEEYTERYHELFSEFLESFDLDAMIAETAAMIAPYVGKDPTKFCSYEEFEQGVETLRQFCTLRCESVRGQLDGSIPSTDEGQSADPDALIDASALTLSELGSMGGGGGGFPSGGDGTFPGGGGGFPGGGSGGSFPGSGFSGGRPGGNGFSNSVKPSSSEEGASPSVSTDGAAPDFSQSDRPQGGEGFGGFPGGAKDETTVTARALTQSDWTMLGVCFAVMLAGILFVRKYRISS